MDKGTSSGSTWACDARHDSKFGFCRRGCTGFGESRGWGRWRCGTCDFDYCDKCYEVRVEALKEEKAAADRAVALKKAQEEEATSGREGAVFREWTKVVDMVCRACRTHFDVDQTDVGRALDKLCNEGLLLRRQQATNEFNVTELALKPPEATAEDMASEEIHEVLGRLHDTTSVTGVNLFRLLVVKFRLPVETENINRATFERGLLAMVLNRRVELPADCRNQARFPPQIKAGVLGRVTWNLSVGALMSVLPRAVTAAFADEAVALLAQAGIAAMAVMPALSSKTPLLEWNPAAREYARHCCRYISWPSFAGATRD